MPLLPLNHLPGLVFAPCCNVFEIHAVSHPHLCVRACDESRKDKLLCNEARGLSGFIADFPKSLHKEPQGAVL